MPLNYICQLSKVPSYAHLVHFYPFLSSDSSDVLDEEVHGYDPPTTQRRYSLQHRDRSHVIHRNRGERSREQRRFMAPFKPDYAINPSKWTKYNLDDDGTKGLIGSGMSADQVNKYAAFEFLKKRDELQRESSEGNEEEEEKITGGKVIFKKPVKESMRGRCERMEEVDKRQGEGVGIGAGVYVMPEYKVGGRKEEIKRGRRRKQLLVLGQGLDKAEKEEVIEKGKKVRSMREKKGKQAVSLGHLEEKEGEMS